MSKLIAATLRLDAREHGIEQFRRMLKMVLVAALTGGVVGLYAVSLGQTLATAGALGR
jgi:hypothetical protein